MDYPLVIQHFAMENHHFHRDSSSNWMGHGFHSYELHWITRGYEQLTSMVNPIINCQVWMGIYQFTSCFWQNQGLVLRQEVLPPGLSDPQEWASIMLSPMIPQWYPHFSIFAWAISDSYGEQSHAIRRVFFGMTIHRIFHASKIWVPSFARRISHILYNWAKNCIVV